MRVIVLGAGVIGTASAWYLARAGHEVVVVDRQPAAALETSFANGGQISVTHSEPWAAPGTPARVLKWLGQPDAPLLFRPRPDLRQWMWGLRFLVECGVARSRANASALLRLAIYSHGELKRLRDETGIDYHAQTRGILALYADSRELAAAVANVDHYRAKGLDVRALDVSGCIDHEPALADARDRFAGGVLAASDESGDAHRFTTQLAELCEGQGVAFRYNTSIESLEARDGRIASVCVRGAEGADERLRADAYVVALGSYSTLLLAPIGVAIPVYPAKGYSITLPVGPDAVAPAISITDSAHELVFSRFGDRLRVAGTAELCGYDTGIDAVRCAAILKRTLELFPRAGRAEEAKYWTGLRPATPSGKPLIGRTRYDNLYLNTGHGTLGWTLACGSGAAITSLIEGRRPEVDFDFLRAPNRASAAA